MRTFSSYGPVDSEEHFSISRPTLVDRCVSELIGSPGKHGHYFTIWAPRQTGKTWLIRQATQRIREEYADEMAVFHFSLGRLRGIQFTPGETTNDFPERLSSLLEDTLPEKPHVTDWTEFYNLFSKTEGIWDRPLILLIDEVDTIPAALLTFMVSQFRELYLNRETNWLQGLALVGVRAVLGVDSKQGSPFNVQRSLQVTNFTLAEVQEDTWAEVSNAARFLEPNNTLMNLIAKARSEEYREFIIQLFTKANIPFAFHEPIHGALYMHGLIIPETLRKPNGLHENVCRFSSPFIQDTLYSALSSMLVNNTGSVLGLDPLDDLADVFAPTNSLDLPALLQRYKDYLVRLKAKGINPWKEQPRRKSDYQLTEAVGHFHLHAWLQTAIGRQCVVSPEFPTGNGRVDLHISYGNQRGIIEVKSFVNQYQAVEDRQQAARYGQRLGLSQVTLALFIPVEDEQVLQALSVTDVINGITVSVVAIGWV